MVFASAFSRLDSASKAMQSVVELCPECSGYDVVRSSQADHSLAYVRLKQRPIGWVVWLAVLSFASNFVLWVGSMIIGFTSEHHAHHLHGWHPLAWATAIGLSMYFATMWIVVFAAVEQFMDRILRRTMYLASAGNMMAASMALLGFICMTLWHISVRNLMAALCVLQLLNLTAMVSTAIYYYDAHKRADEAKSLIATILPPHVRSLIFTEEWPVVRGSVQDVKTQ